MTAWKQTGSLGAAARDEADSKSAAKSDGAEERKPSTKCRKGMKAKGKLAVKSNGAGKHKTHDLSDVTHVLAVMSIAEVKSKEEALGCAVMRISKELPREEALALFVYQNNFWRENRSAVYDKASGEAVLKAAAENWKFFNASDKAPYLAKARLNQIRLAEFHELKKTLKLTRVMTDKMMNLKM